MKRIILCCDGTWNKPGSTDRKQVVKTNVQKIFEAVGEGEEVKQVKFYGKGVGTGFSLKDRILGGGTGHGIDVNIQDAYKFLVWNFEPGDHVYLFGFSRGAYTVRSLGGLIRNCGILKPEFLHYVEEAYQLYRERTALTHPDSDLMKGFRNVYSYEDSTSIYFMGVWDTVGALGIPLHTMSFLNKKYQFHDVKLSSHVKYAYHALAIDEKRKIFEPTLWELSSSTLAGENEQVCEQVWFPGVHSNVGGGYADGCLSDIALQWMMDKAALTGLAFDETYKDCLTCDPCGELRNSATGLFQILGKKDREINNSFAKHHSAEQGRKEKEITRNERIHYTALERRHKIKNYKPRNIESALKLNTGFDPDHSAWLPEWKDYWNNA